MIVIAMKCRYREVCAQHTTAIMAADNHHAIALIIDVN